MSESVRQCHRARGWTLRARDVALDERAGRGVDEHPSGRRGRRTWTRSGRKRAARGRERPGDEYGPHGGASRDDRPAGALPPVGGQPGRENTGWGRRADAAKGHSASRLLGDRWRGAGCRRRARDEGEEQETCDHLHGRRTVLGPARLRKGPTSRARPCTCHVAPFRPGRAGRDRRDRESRTGAEGVWVLAPEQSVEDAPAWLYRGRGVLEDGGRRTGVLGSLEVTQFRLVEGGHSLLLTRLVRGCRLIRTQALVDPLDGKRAP